MSTKDTLVLLVTELRRLRERSRDNQRKVQNAKERGWTKTVEREQGKQLGLQLALNATHALIRSEPDA